QLVDARRRGERSDAQRVEERGDESDRRLNDGRPHEATANDSSEVDDEHRAEADEKKILGVHIQCSRGPTPRSRSLGGGAARRFPPAGHPNAAAALGWRLALAAGAFTVRDVAPTRWCTSSINRSGRPAPCPSIAPAVCAPRRRLRHP